MTATAPNPLGEAPIRALFFKYYVPALISILSTTFHQVINGIILGQQVGKEGLAAVGLYGPVVIVFVALTLPIMIGGGILIGKSLGATDYTKAQQIFQFATTLVLSIGGLVALSAPLLTKPLAQFLAGSGNTVSVQNTADYISWQLITLPFFFLGMIWGNFIRTDGAPNVSRNASLTAVVVNVVLDLLLIVGFDMGVGGASIATAVAFFSGTCYCFVFIQKGKSRYSFRNFRFTLKLKEWKDLLALGLPTFASELSFSSGLLLISHSITSYGPLAVSAFGLINYLSFTFIRPLTAAMIASLPIMSFNIGAKLPHRVLEVVRFSLVFTLGLGLVVAVIGFALPELLIAVFSGDKTTAFEQVASPAMSFYFILFIAAGPNYILSAYLQSIGKSTISTLIAVLKGFILIAIFLAVLPGYFDMGLNGVWLSRSLAEIVTLMLVGIYTFYYKERFYAEQAIVRRG